MLKYAQQLDGINPKIYVLIAAALHGLDLCTVLGAKPLVFAWPVRCLVLAAEAGA